MLLLYRMFSVPCHLISILCLFVLEAQSNARWNEELPDSNSIKQFGPAANDFHSNTIIAVWTNTHNAHRSKRSDSNRRCSWPVNISFKVHHHHHHHHHHIRNRHHHHHHHHRRRRRRRHQHHHHHHHHLSVMELGHLFTRSGLTYPEVSSKVCHDSFRHLGNSVNHVLFLQFIILYLCTGPKTSLIFRCICPL